MYTQHLFLLREMVKRDFVSRYAGSLLGFFWSFFQPLWLLLLYTFVFSTVLRISLMGQRTGSFAIFLFCGLLPWMAIHEGVFRAATSITDNAELVKKVRFPSQLLVLTVVVSALLHAGIAFLVFLAVLAFKGELALGGLPLLLVALPIQFALALGLGLTVAALQVLFRDTVQMLGMLLAGWFFFTPIVYPLNQVPEEAARWLQLNPLTVVVSLYRSALLGGSLEWVPGTGGLCVVAAVVLGTGLWIFGRLRPTFADEI